MADLDRSQGQGVPLDMVSKYVDMGDGTHALQMAVGAPSGGGGIPVTGPLTDAELRATAVVIEEESHLGIPGNVDEPGAAAAAVVTRAAGGAGVINKLASIHWSLSDDPAAHVNLMVEDGVGNTIFSTDITNAGPGFEPFDPPMEGSDNTAMIVTVANPGGAVLAKLSVHAWYA